jgi:hypothetical protein
MEFAQCWFFLSQGAKKRTDKTLGKWIYSLNPPTFYKICDVCYLSFFNYIFNKYKTFSVLIYSYVNTSGNWENEKLCENKLCLAKRLPHPPL